MSFDQVITDSDEELDDTSIFENKAGLSDDMRFLASMPELCDVTFLVGETREPVCAVKAVLGARSRYQKYLFDSFIMLLHLDVLGSFKKCCTFHPKNLPKKRTRP